MQKGQSRHYPNYYTLQLRVQRRSHNKPTLNRCWSDEPDNKHTECQKIERTHGKKWCDNRLSTRPVYDWLFRLFASGIAYLNPNMFTFICAVWSGVSINVERDTHNGKHWHIKLMDYWRSEILNVVVAHIFCRKKLSTSKNNQAFE